MNSFSVFLLSVSCSTLAASMGGNDIQRQSIRQHKQNIVRSEGGALAELEVRPLGSMVLKQAKASSHSLAPDSLLDITLDSASQDLHSAAPVTATQVPNNLAAFEVASAGIAHFNGVYMPSTTANTAQACSSLTWEMTNAGGQHMLYNLGAVGGAWNLDLTGSSPPYNGGDNGACAPESAAWAGVGTGAGAAPTVTRAAAASYNTTAKAALPPNFTANGTNATAATAPTAAPKPQTYFVVTNAGIPGFNGVYYTTPLVVADQRCERTFAKDGPDNTEYTLAFGNPMWYFQSMIGGKMSRPYVAQDDGSCSPDQGTWKALTPAGGAVPAVARSNTATPTTTTTIATTTTRPITTRVFTNTTTVAGVATTTTVPAAPGATTTTVVALTSAAPAVKAHGSRSVSMWWLRLLAPLTLGLALERLSLGL